MKKSFHFRLVLFWIMVAAFIVAMAAMYMNVNCKVTSISFCVLLAAVVVEAIVSNYNKNTKH